MKMAGLQAYIQKYGIDKNAALALQKLQAEADAAMWSGIGSLLGKSIPWIGQGLGFWDMFGGE